MLDLILEYRDEAQSAFSWALCMVALIWGGGPERALALVWLVIFKLIAGVSDAVTGGIFHASTVSVLGAGIDVAALILMILVAVKANRFYPLWIAAFQILATLAHFASAMAEHITPIAYVILAFTPGYFQLLLLAGGLAAHIRRVREHGTYRDWQKPIATVQAFSHSEGAK